jgi:hypothetical protein
MSPVCKRFERIDPKTSKNKAMGENHEDRQEEAEKSESVILRIEGFRESEALPPGL